MQIRMPGSITQASQGGTCPRTFNNIPIIHYNKFEERVEDDKEMTEDATWVVGGVEEDNKRYREFLEYC